MTVSQFNWPSLFAWVWCSWWIFLVWMDFFCIVGYLSFLTYAAYPSLMFWEVLCFIVLVAFSFFSWFIFIIFPPNRFMTLTGITKMSVLLSSQQNFLSSGTAWLMPSLLCFYLHGTLRLNGESMNFFLSVAFGGTIGY